MAPLASLHQTHVDVNGYRQKKRDHSAVEPKEYEKQTIGLYVYVTKHVIYNERRGIRYGGAYRVTKFVVYSQGVSRCIMRFVDRVPPVRITIPIFVHRFCDDAVASSELLHGNKQSH